MSLIDDVAVMGNDNTCAYDLGGNMTVRREMVGTETFTYPWGLTIDNRLASVIKSDVTGTILATTTIAYDGDGVRVKKTDPSGATYYLGVVEVLITGTTQVTTSYYAFGGAMVAMRDGAGAALVYLHGDHLGSASLATSMTGTVVSQQRYAPYGAVRWASGSMPTDFTFTSQRAGPANYVGSLMDYLARGYSPTLGRFISADKIVPGAGNPQAFNRYMYVRGNPLKLIDPTGHRPADDDSDDGVPSEDMPMKSVCVPDYCVLDPAYDATIKKYAEAFGIPEALLRTTQLVEAQDDQEWYSGLANGFISRYSEYADSGSVLQPLANLSLGLIEGYFRARHADNGIGIENVHVQPASDAEKYFSANYPGTEMARLVAPGKNMAQMLKSFKTVEGNTMYAAAILRELADQRTGKSGSHMDSLSVVDEAIIYGAYRSGIGSYPKESGGFTGASVPGGFGNTYLRYRNLGPTRPSNGPN